MFTRRKRKKDSETVSKSQRNGKWTDQRTKGHRANLQELNIIVEHLTEGDVSL